MSRKTTFTSESVCAGHPDKICDQISDAILDAVLEQDPFGKVAVETLVTKNRVIIAGEVAAAATVDFAGVACQQIRRLGYTIAHLQFTDQAEINVLVHEQSLEIAHGVSRKKKGAGDQGMMFGYACRETPELMPLPITMAHAMAAAIDAQRESEGIAGLRPDGKSQVTVKYEDGTPIGVSTVVLAAPHDEAMSQEQLKEELIRQVVEPILKKYGFEDSCPQVIVNGTGVWHFSGPAADTGLTGRKIIVDTYGGYARVGGGAFSGKDPSKVDRSGAYAARYIAKNIVAQGLADRAEVRLAYCIGQPKPIMKEVETFGTLKVKEKELAVFVDGLLDCSVEGIIEALKLRRPIYGQTAAYGHFGREGLAWEKIRD